MKGKIVSINISEKKGERKTPVQEAVIKEDYGIVGDAHAGGGKFIFANGDPRAADAGTMQITI